MNARKFSRLVFILMMVLFLLVPELSGAAAQAPAPEQPVQIENMLPEAIESAVVNGPPYYAYLPVCVRSCANYFDNFSSPSSGWWVWDMDYIARMDYLGGEYRILGRDTDYMFISDAPTCKRQNYTVEVDARQVSGFSDFGLVFGMNEDITQFYAFSIDAIFQEYALFYYNEYSTNQFTVLQNYTKSSSIKTMGNYNHLKVTRNGSQISLNINGTNLGTWNHSAVQGLSNVGVINSPYDYYYDYHYDSDVRFDNFSVTLLPDTTLSPAEVQAAETAVGPASDTVSSLPRGMKVFENERR
jgi:hypothetical protein